MDTDTLVENQIEDGQKLLARLVRSGFDVSSACWVKTSEEGRWYLYIASNDVDRKGPAPAYGAAYGVLLAMESPWISVSEVKLVSPQAPIGRDLATILGKQSGRAPTRTHRPPLGDVAFEDAYVYPHQTGQMTRDEVLQAVASLMNRSGLAPPATVTFRDGSTIRAVPVSVRVPHPGKVEIELLDVETNTARTADAHEVANIH